MAVAQSTVFDANVKCMGDFVDIDGTLNVDGITTLTSLKLSAATFQTNGAAWATTAATPTFVSGQTYMTVTCGATVFRIPLFANA
jgi:hypothetical protein